MDDSVEEQKKRLRAEFLGRRKELAPAERIAANDCIVKTLHDRILRYASPGSGGAGSVVSLYRAFRGEVDVWPCAQRLWIAGFEVAVPVTNTDARTMQLVRIEPDTVWRQGAYGILEPKVSAAALVDDSSIKCIVVPGVAFTRSGVRLGYGGGYYDRFFSAFRGITRAIAIGTAFACQIADELPTLPHDIRMDVVITEDEVMECTPRPSS